MAAPAGFWRRYAAWSLDAALIAALLLPALWPLLHADFAQLGRSHHTLLHDAGRSLGAALVSGVTLRELPMQWLGDPVLRADIRALGAALFTALWLPLLAFAVIGAPYHALFEASPRQATPGQRALGLRVVDLSGQRIGALRALRRHVAGALSWLSLNAGHALALAAPHKRALHDYLAGTRMLQACAVMPLPGWARAWLALQLLALLSAAVALHAISSDAMQAGIDSILDDIANGVRQ